jgi:hypothetical protein
MAHESHGDLYHRIAANLVGDSNHARVGQTCSRQLPHDSSQLLTISRAKYFVNHHGPQRGRQEISRSTSALESKESREVESHACCPAAALLRPNTTPWSSKAKALDSS